MSHPVFLFLQLSQHQCLSTWLCTRENSTSSAGTSMVSCHSTNSVQSVCFSVKVAVVAIICLS